MKIGILKKWLLGLSIICSMMLMIGCTDVSTDATEDNEITEIKEESIDTQSPSIIPKELTVEYGDTLNYSDLVSVTDDSSDEIELSVAHSGATGIIIDEDRETIVLGAIGTFEFTVTAEDTSGNKSEAEVSIVVEDHEQPVLSLTKTTFSLTVGDAAPSYASVATASDNVDGDLTASILVDTSKVNYKSAGTYEITYTVADSSGNESVCTATVTVVAKPQTTSSNNNKTSTNVSQVMITRTGECYHKRKCGNGTYFWVSLSEAKSRGLRPCQKCY